jgi:hypothetical protein
MHAYMICLFRTVLRAILYHLQEAGFRTGRIYTLYIYMYTYTHIHNVLYHNMKHCLYVRELKCTLHVCIMCVA